MEIDWNNPASPISRHFTVREALWLPTWGRLAREADGLTDEIRDTLARFASRVMDPLRDLLGEIIVHCWYRPPTYNALIGGAPGSAHMCLGTWAACDFHVENSGTITGCAATRSTIMPWLEPLQIRMEDIIGNWIHVDSHPLIGGQARVFSPGGKK